jgi:hypothetical protein
MTVVCKHGCTQDRNKVAEKSERFDQMFGMYVSEYFLKKKNHKNRMVLTGSS